MEINENGNEDKFNNFIPHSNGSIIEQRIIQQSS